MNIADEYSWNTGFQQQTIEEKKLSQASLDQIYQN